MAEEQRAGNNDAKRMGITREKEKRKYDNKDEKQRRDHSIMDDRQRAATGKYKKDGNKEWLKVMRGLVVKMVRVHEFPSRTSSSNMSS